MLERVTEHRLAKNTEEKSLRRVSSLIVPITLESTVMI